MILDKQSRLQWVDAMRGFSMLVVVFGHVLLHMGIGGYDSFLSSVLLTFRMPLFFFVSGFFSYRLLSWWDKDKVKDILTRKVQAQIICTLAFLSVYQMVIGGGKIGLAEGFGGYWFTIVLFQMYLIYLVFVGISKAISRDIVIVSLIFVSVIFLAVLIVYNRSAWIWNFLCWENLTKYTQFFVLGIICSKYRDRFFKLLENNIFVTLMISSWIIFMILWYNDGFQNTFPIIYSFIHDIAVRYVALMTVVIIFFSNKKFYNNNSRVSRCIIFIGQRTLDIYMIHYFLLPNMYVLKEYFNSGNTIIFQILIGGGITIAIVAVCLLISSILRKSKTLAIWLFGVKTKKILQN